VFEVLGAVFGAPVGQMFEEDIRGAIEEYQEAFDEFG
jgi:hypothetical protein